jgi:hypothetical protein
MWRLRLDGRRPFTFRKKASLRGVAALALTEIPIRSGRPPFATGAAEHSKQD